MSRCWLATIALYIAWRYSASVRLLPTILAVKSVNYAIAMPTNDSVSIISESRRDFATLLAMRPNANDALALLLGVFDFPVDVMTFLGLWRDVNNHCSAISNARCKNTGFDIVFRMRIIWVICIDGIVAHCYPILRQQGFQLSQTGVIPMDMANEDVLDLIWHTFPLARFIRRGSKISTFIILADSLGYGNVPVTQYLL